MPDLLRLIWDRGDRRDPVWAADEVALWPDGAITQLISAGLLRPTAPAQAAVCDACSGDHVAEVTLRQRGHEEEPQAFLRCPEAGRVRIPLSRLRRWALDLDRLAAETCGTLDLAGDVECLVLGRVWRLGKRDVGGESRLCLMLCGLGWPDGGQVLDRTLSALGYDAREVCLFVPGDLVPPHTAKDETPLVIPLGQVLVLDEKGLRADTSRLGGGKRKGRSRSPVRVSASFPTPARTAWPDVEIVVSDFNLKVTVRGKSREYSFAAAGFEDRRKGDYPNAAWELLKIMAASGGVFPAGRQTLSRASSSLKQSVSQLGKNLRTLLHIDGNPFRFEKKESRYEARFGLSSSEKARITVPDGTTWDQVAITEEREGVLSVSVACSEVAPDFILGGDDGDIGRWEAVEREGTRVVRHDLRALGLSDRDGTVVPLGQALLDVLRRDGRVSRSARDKDMLKLGPYLNRLFGIQRSPFQFSPSKTIWSALFEASSQIRQGER